MPPRGVGCVETAKREPKTRRRVCLRMLWHRILKVPKGARGAASSPGPRVNPKGAAFGRPRGALRAPGAMVRMEVP